ncbi:MAG: hypothetical protein HOV87_31265 [Catenulispora sp.]|nr:hypothetical protein [Catenulispora sp.]
MAGEEYRFIGQAARIADELAPRVALGRAKQRGGDEGGSSGGKLGSSEPISIPLISALDEFDRDLQQELAIHKRALGTTDGVPQRADFPNRKSGAAFLEKTVTQIPAEVADHTTVTFLRHRALLGLLFARLEGYEPQRCPEGHTQEAPWDRIPARTLIPAHVFDGGAGWKCQHPVCALARAGSDSGKFIREAATSNRLVTAQQLGLLLGISELAARARIRRAEAAGAFIPVIDTVGPPGARKNRWNLAHLLTVSSIRRDLGVMP